MNALYVLLGILFVLGSKLMIAGLRNASDGYEDIHGFHLGKLPRQKRRSLREVAQSLAASAHADPFDVTLKPLAGKPPASRTAALLSEHRIATRRLWNKREDGKTCRLMRRPLSDMLS